METAIALFDLFCSKGAEHFPFVVFSPHTSVELVRRDTPFLFLNILAAMLVNNAELQRQLGENIRTQIYRRMLLGYESNLELLQGLLVYLAWHHSFMLPHRHQILLLSHLSVNLVQQLALDQQPKNKRQHLAGECECDPEEPDSASDTNSLTKLRIMLGTFYISSS